MHRGYIKIWRKFKDWQWYHDPPTRVLFIELLLSVTHKPIRYAGVELPVGSIITGRNKLAEESGLTVKQVRRALDNLEKTGEIERKRANKYSIITVCNYERYHQNENSVGPAEGQQRASRGPLNKNEKNEKNNTSGDYTERFELFWKEYPNKKGKSKAFLSWKRFKCENGIFEDIMKALARQKNSKDWLKDGGRYIPNGSTWVNGKRWEDETGEEIDEWI